jgi:hypothetical protein
MLPTKIFETTFKKFATEKSEKRAAPPTTRLITRCLTISMPFHFRAKTNLLHQSFSKTKDLVGSLFFDRAKQSLKPASTPNLFTKYRTVRNQCFSAPNN